MRNEPKLVNSGTVNLAQNFKYELNFELVFVKCELVQHRSYSGVEGFGRSSATAKQSHSCRERNRLSGLQRHAYNFNEFM